MHRNYIVVRFFLPALLLAWVAGAEPKEITNSIGMRLVRIESGEFTMGFTGEPLSTAVAVRPWRVNGDFDEHPAHPVRITKAFYMGAFEVTNAQYERFDPSHKAIRGTQGFSKEDNEAVVFVNWEEANRFCQWLSKKEGKAYRLPTEAEWEYSARAGTTTHYHTGDTLLAAYLKNATASVYPPLVPVITLVGQTPPNAWGLHDVHGNVEEWVFDWYGAYEPDEQTDPVGRITGDFRVTRGGSHSTEAYFLRSENRMGTLPEDKQGLIGFRVAMGPMPKTKPLPAPPPPLNQRDASQATPRDLRQGPDPNKPYFHAPRKYVKIPRNRMDPYFPRIITTQALSNVPTAICWRFIIPAYRKPVANSHCWRAGCATAMKSGTKPHRSGTRPTAMITRPRSGSTGKTPSISSTASRSRRSDVVQSETDRIGTRRAAHASSIRIQGERRDHRAAFGRESGLHDNSQP